MWLSFALLVLLIEVALTAPFNLHNRRNSTPQASSKVNINLSHRGIINVDSLSSNGETSAKIAIENSHLYLNVSTLLDLRFAIKSLLSSNLFGSSTCSFMSSTGSAIKSVMNSSLILPPEVVNIIKEYPIMLHSPCFSANDIGNKLSDFFESFLCSQVVGLHYLDISPERLSNGLFNKLGAAISNRRPKPKDALMVDSLNKRCICKSVCHEKRSSLVFQHTNLIGSIFSNAMHNYWSSSPKHEKVLHPSQIYLSHIPPNFNSKSKDKIKKINNPSSLSSSEFPIVPDVSIHYRCGDNLVGHYGFLPFRVLKARIPRSSSSIYILSESATRKGVTESHSRCDLIFNSMMIYLKKHFESSLILIVRGADPFVDLGRLSLSNTVICSVSTFCFWPAISRQSSVYFPVSRLIARSDIPDPPYIGPFFKWINGTNERIVKGIEAKHLSIDKLLDILNAE